VQLQPRLPKTVSCIRLAQSPARHGGKNRPVFTITAVLHQLHSRSSVVLPVRSNHAFNIISSNAPGAPKDMDTVHIAELSPELPARQLKQFKAAVTLIWPYSSSQREFALLLSEPDFRLRRKKGQVRARFTGSSARALATTGVGIGDEVVLSLRGAQFVQEGTVSTPGKSIDWELEYTQTVVVHIFRNGGELASLDMADVAPTPAPRSPVRRDTTAAQTPAKQWSSPAFLKRARLSDGPFFHAPYDPLAAENEEGHGKKRRRKSYRDWKAWTYSDRTPSPEKTDVGDEEEFDGTDASPSRPTQLPHTPVSPPRLGTHSSAAQLLDRVEGADSAGQDVHRAVAVSGVNKATEDEAEDDATMVRDRNGSVLVNGYFDIYALADRIAPADDQYAFGGDTEANTEEEDGLEDTDGGSIGATEVSAGNLEDDRAQINEDDHLANQLVVIDGEKSAEEDDSFVEMMNGRHAADSTIEDAEEKEMEPELVDELAVSEDAHAVTMPPPILPYLNTHLLAPASPTLHPLDSATLPMPSPFPGEQDIDIASYFEQFTNDQQHGDSGTAVVQELELPSEADYIFENSFFSSIGTSKPSALHPDHETAFTPVRFTFGMDGAGFSRPMELSSPAPEKAHSNVDDPASGDNEAQHSPQELQAVQFGSRTSPSYPALSERDTITRREHQRRVPLLSLPGGTRNTITAEATSPSSEEAIEAADKLEVIDLSSDSESAESEVSKHEGNRAGEERASSTVEIDEEDLPLQVHTEPNSTDQSPMATIIDLGSLSDDSNGVRQLIADHEHGSQEAVDPADDVQHNSATTDQDQDRQPASQYGAATIPRSSQSHSELQAVDLAPTPSNIGSTAQEGPSTHTPNLQAPEDFIEPSEDSRTMLIEEPQVATGELEMYTHDNYLPGESSGKAQLNLREVDEDHPDIKMESIEEDLLHSLDQVDQQESGPTLDNPTVAPSGEILITVPEEGHKIGELHTISVPATGPARNTRSKARTSVTPTGDESPASKRTTRSARSRVSVVPSHQTSASPPRTRGVSTVSLSQDPSRTSPYSLRSQSKLISPPRSTSATTVTRQNSRRHASKRSVDSIPDAGPSQLDNPDPFLTSFKPSQGLEVSQGRYSNVSLVKDLEEESLHSEHSISNLNKYSDDWTAFTNLSNPVVPHEQDETENLKPLPTTAPELKTRTGAKTRSNTSKTQVAVSKSSPSQPDISLIAQSPPINPSRQLRSTSSVETASPSPRIVRTTRRKVYDLTSSPPPDEGELVTPKAERVNKTIYSALPSEGERSIPSLPPAPTDSDELLHSSPKPATTEPAPTHHRPITRSTRPITPEATQQTNMDSQASLDIAQRQQSSPITPQLTQPTSGHRSFTRSMNLPNTIPETLVKSSPVTKSTIRHNAAQTDVASPSASPQAHSPDASSDIDAALIEKPDGPSIGLSTPLAYYTPLSSLTYFLNRSSQFHTDSNPDFLALVTSGSTTPQRATKGPKHWTTTLHITDLSTWPATTTVNIFRAYQTALPHADTGDVILLRAFAVKSLNRHPTLISADESAWCVWRYGKPVWGAKRGAFGEVRAREEMKGPVVERGEGEWREVERVRRWFLEGVKGELEEGQRQTRSHDKEKKNNESNVDADENDEGRITRSRDKGKGKEGVIDVDGNA
jgi:hypothetical protein